MADLGIKEIEALTEEEVKEIAEEMLVIKEHNIYLVDFEGYFGYSRLVFKNNHHIYYANDYELHHNYLTKDKERSEAKALLRERFIEGANNILFTEEEIQYILNHWGKESPNSMKKRFNCSWYAVCKVAEQHDLEIPTSNHWTEREIKKLERLSWKYSISEIAKKMKKSELAVYIKARRLGIPLIQSRRKWTKDEEELLSELWGVKPIEKIAKDLKRTVFSLKVKAVRMGLGPMIQNNNDVITISDICDILKVTRDRVSTTWVKLGLNLNSIKLTDNMTYLVVVWEDLLDFLERNQNEWDSRYVEINMLGAESEWLHAKRLRDSKENPLLYRRWTEEEIKHAEWLLRTGKTYIEIAHEINRSEVAVAYMLRSRGYSYRLPQFWKGRELKYLRENYQNMTYAEIGEELGRTEKAVAYKAAEMGYQKKIGKLKNNDSEDEL